MTKQITNMCNTFGLKDPKRKNDPLKKQYTWSQGITNMLSRLDFFLSNDK